MQSNTTSLPLLHTTAVQTLMYSGLLCQASRLHAGTSLCALAEAAAEHAVVVLPQTYMVMPLHGKH